MSKLVEAEKRLQRAVSALEDAARARSGGSDVAPAATESGDMAAVEELRAVNASVAEKLDGAILRVKKILED